MDYYTSIVLIKQTDTKCISIVRNQIDQLFYIKRELKVFDQRVYQTLQNIQSDYFPRIERIRNVDGKLEIIEEYFNTETFDIYMANHVLSRKERYQIIYQLCEALQILHEHGIIYRDLKPENMIYDRGRIILFDFDISRLYENGKNKDTQCLGSAGYASPEQYGFGQSDARSDIYSLGILMKELIPERTKIIEKATHIDPQKRYQTCEEIKKLLFHDKVHGKIIYPGWNNENLITRIASIFYIVVMFCSLMLPRIGEPYIFRQQFNYFLSMYALIFCIQNTKNIPLATKNQRTIAMTLIYILFFFIICIVELYAEGIPAA